MNRELWQPHGKSLLDDERTRRKIELNLRKNREQDNTEALDALAASFRYEDCAGEYWNPEQFSLLYGTRLWEESTAAQRVKLNQLYWVAYYSQIISAEIATIFFNQTSAAGLYGIEDFRIVCDTLDLESMQERAHIAAFKRISEEFEARVFGERLFTYPMRTPYAETMVFHDTGRIKAFWKQLQLRAFTLLSSGNAFIGCQYFTVRGVRTLNGKLVQHQLSQYYMKHPAQETAPIPSQVSWRHFLDESFHFNSSNFISHDVVNTLKEPTPFEAWVANKGLHGTQRDHFGFSTAVNGLFWHDPALYPVIYKILRSPIFSMEHREALQMMEDCFTRDSDGLQAANNTRLLAIHSYKEYVSSLKYIDEVNREMSIMSGNDVYNHLAVNQQALKAFARRQKPHENHLRLSAASAS